MYTISYQFLFIHKDAEFVRAENEFKNKPKERTEKLNKGTNER